MSATTARVRLVATDFEAAIDELAATVAAFMAP
jgi:hypothetical protein